MATPRDYLTTAQVCERYGGVTPMTLHRWRNDGDLNFPKPEPIRSRNYWRIEQLDSWDAVRKKALPQSVEGESHGT
jgi:predicted DNA-binding transcriptional regulator AlpA